MLGWDVLPSRVVVVWGVALLLMGAACGAATDDHQHEPPGGGACEDCGGAAGAPNPASRAGADEGGASSVGQGGAGEAGQFPTSAAGEGGAAGAPIPPDLSLRALTISQTLEIPLMRAGAEVPLAGRLAPILTGKRALVRAFVDVVTPFHARQLLGVLDIDTGETTRSLLSERSIDASSTQDDLGSSFVFEVAGDDLTPNASYRMRVLEADTTPLARFPEDGYLKLAARSLPAFQLVIVPYVVGGFVPKTGESELAALRRRLLALYPSAGVDITVATPVTLGYPVKGSGGGWDDALDEIYDQRAAAKPAPDVFYFGLMAPAASFDEFCADGCTLGYSTVADADDADARGSIGVGVFPDGSGSEEAWDTVAHELGHALGRDHAPCPAPPNPNQPDGIDPRWPEDALHKNATIGSYGYDFDALKLIKARVARDIMSYCTPSWISDYTYTGIFKRLDQIQSESFRVLDAAPRERFRLARITRDGQARWLADRYRHGRARTVTVELLDAAGRPVGQVQAQVARLDHAAGGYVWLSARELQASGAVAVDLSALGGGRLAL